MIARAALLARSQGRLGEAVVSTVIARLTDLLALLLIGGALGPLMLAARPDRSLAVTGPLGLVLLTVLGLVVLRQGRLPRLPRRAGHDWLMMRRKPSGTFPHAACPARSASRC